jgi:hypothetical protein
LRQLLFRARTTLRAAASAIVPLPVVAWAASRGASSAPMSERVTELVGGGGSVGLAAGLTKAVVIVTAAGTVAGGGVAVDRHFETARHGDHASVVRRPAARARASTAAHVVSVVARPAARATVRRVRAPVHPTAPQTHSTGQRSGGLAAPSKSGASGDGRHGGSTGERDGASAPSAADGQRTDPPPPTATTSDDAVPTTDTATEQTSLGESTDASRTDDSSASLDATPTGSDTRAQELGGD